MTVANKAKIETLENEIESIEAANRADTQYQLFRGQDLEGRDFSGQDLTGCNFREANLKNCDFTGAILHYANFKDADVTGATFDANTKTSFSAWLVRVPVALKQHGAKITSNKRSIGNMLLDVLKVDDKTAPAGEAEIQTKHEEMQAIIDKG